jgi:hypothetical protein
MPPLPLPLNTLAPTLTCAAAPALRLAHSHYRQKRQPSLPRRAPSWFRVGLRADFAGAGPPSVNRFAVRLLSAADTQKYHSGHREQFAQTRLNSGFIPCPPCPRAPQVATLGERSGRHENVRWMSAAGHPVSSPDAPDARSHPAPRSQMAASCAVEPGFAMAFTPRGCCSPSQAPRRPGSWNFQSQDPHYLPPHPSVSLRVEPVFLNPRLLPWLPSLCEPCYTGPDIIIPGGLPI